MYSKDSMVILPQQDKYRSKATDRVLRPKAQAELLGVSRTSLWRLRLEPGFPKVIRVGVGSVGRLESELLAWLHSRQEV
ncbi:AlpA family phage regulatory protein [Geomonas nitrogeniifigens]|uniref:helix-turn-helix transcriptional regulator n=1 Tax=Geomonas diazotrophica TaxID=2843197 RepID=UPI001C2BE002|nr:AlpA family phage regulatory protein [Geomonas nitrogeniifigens]